MFLNHIYDIPPAIIFEIAAAQNIPGTANNKDPKYARGMYKTAILKIDNIEAGIGLFNAFSAELDSISTAWEP